MLLSGALAQLSPDHRAVIKRSYYQGWTTAQIAADLDIAEGTVKSRLHYALRALRLTLQEMGCGGTRRSQPPSAFHNTRSLIRRVSVGAVHNIGRGHRDSTQMANHSDDDQSRLSLPVLLNECSWRR